jgi:hypothetical protein
VKLKVIGAGLPRTGTTSLSLALSKLLNGRVNNMSAIEGHPFNLGEGWQTALAGGKPDWDSIFETYIAAVDWPASAFWQELSNVYPDALIILSSRDSAQQWYESMSATILPVAREALADGWTGGRDLLTLFEGFTGTSQWDNAEILKAAYERHNMTVRELAPKNRFLDWTVSDGWKPLCDALNLPIPAEPFPWVNKRSDWG